MKRGQRYLSVILAVLMCLSLLPVGALADDEAPAEDAYEEAAITAQEETEEIEILPEETPAETEEPAETETQEPAAELDIEEFIEAEEDEAEAEEPVNTEILTDNTAVTEEFDEVELSAETEDVVLDGAGTFTPAWPLKKSYRINALDRYSSGSQHNGIDIDANGYPTQDVYAVADGVVEQVSNTCSHSSVSGDQCGYTWGNYVLIKHTVNGVVYHSRYAHLTKDSITVSVGDTVSGGQKIGKMGSSGSSTGPHLHLEIYQGERGSGSSSTCKAQYSFDYYQSNTGIISQLLFSTHNGTSSVRYGSWIKSNYTISNGVYKYSGTTTSSTATLSISGAVYPSGTLTSGKSFGLRGIISSGYKLTNVSAYVYDIYGTAKLSYSVNPGATSYNIQTGGLNSAFSFGKLSDGSYRYVVKATDASGTTKTLIDSDFVIGTATVASYTMSFNANGGSGSMSSMTVKYGSNFTLTANAFTKTGYTFSGWNVKRNGDGKWYVKGQGWLSDSEISSGGYTRAVYADEDSKTFDDSWTKGYSGTSSYTFYAIWTAKATAETSSLQLGVTNAAAKAGGTVTVSVQVKNNPGIKGISAVVDYDSTVLQLVSASGKISTGTWEIDTIAADNAVLWYSDTAFTADGDIMTLTFRVKDSAKAGTTAVSLKFGAWDSVSDVNGNDIEGFSVVAGTVTIGDRTPGDVNGDGKVNISDVVRLAEYVKARGTGVQVVSGSTDINGDGKVNISDVVRLAEYVKARGTGVVIY